MDSTNLLYYIDIAVYLWPINHQQPSKMAPHFTGSVSILRLYKGDSTSCTLHFYHILHHEQPFTFLNRHRTFQ